MAFLWTVGVVNAMVVFITVYDFFKYNCNGWNCDGLLCILDNGVIYVAPFYFALELVRFFGVCNLNIKKTLW